MINAYNIHNRHSILSYEADTSLLHFREVPINVRIGFGKGYESVTKSRIFNALPKLTQNIIYELSVREEPVFYCKIHGSSYGYTLYECVTFYEKIKSDIEVFGYKCVYNNTVVDTDSIATFSIMEKSNDKNSYRASYYWR